MKKYIIGAVLVGAVLGGATAHAASYGASILRGTLFGVVEAGKGKQLEVYKLVDGATTCYVVGATAAISCVK